MVDFRYAYMLNDYREHRKQHDRQGFCGRVGERNGPGKSLICLATVRIATAFLAVQLENWLRKFQITALASMVCEL